MPSERRPLKTRQHQWAHHLAALFVRAGLSPNQMSVAGVLVAALGSGLLFYVGTTPLVLLAFAVCIQLRLLANMLDGLMAIEQGKKTATGPLYNEVPDRAADILFLVAAGYAVQLPDLGWAAAMLAVLTAYVRAVGASLGAGHDFSGPMAKPHRMFTLTLVSLLAALWPMQPFLYGGLVLIAAGSALTLLRRLWHIAAYLKAQPAP